MTSMKQRVQIGTRWLRRRDKTVWIVRQAHRSDRIAELVPEDGPRLKCFVTFTDLRTKFEEADA